MIPLVRIAAAVLAGLILVSGLTEMVEFGLVSLVNHGATREQAQYFAIRNRPAFLAGKLVYNLLFAGAGGWVAARIAPGGRRTSAAVALAAIQTAALIWGALGTPYSRWTPAWMWLVLILGTGPAILLGAKLHRRR